VPEIRGAATVLLVRDVARSVAYYRDQLGFETSLFEQNPEHYGYANRGKAWFHFARWDGVEPRPNAIAVPPDMFEAYLYVDDVTALHEELVERGADLLHGPEERPWTRLEIRVRDPDGYVLAFGEAEQ
jgi:catechol 2,3-dioxygenase-like lactoylglutathione lyase family enzyme